MLTRGATVERYRHTQVGWLMVGVTVALAAVFALTQRSLLSAGPGAWPLLLFPLLLALFGWLTVSVGDDAVRARFGIGLFGPTVPLADVRECSVVTSPWWWGWGIRCFPGGTLYNVSGLRAVELRLASGRRLRIGSDQPEALAAAIRAAVGPLPPARGSAAPAGQGRAARVAGWALGLLLLSFLGFLALVFVREPRDPAVTVSSERLSVESSVYSAEVPLREVVAVSLEPSFRPRRRTNGFAAADVLRGHFEVDGLGPGMVFANLSSPPFLLVRRAGGGFVIVGFDEPARTRALHDELQAARSRFAHDEP